MPTHNNEKGGENGETHQLDGLASPRVNKEECKPVARDEATNGKDNITDGDIFKGLIYAKRAFLR